MRNNSTSPRSALSQIAWPPNAWPVGGALLVALGIAFLYVAAPAAYIGFAARAGLVDPHAIFAHPQQILIAQVSAYVVVVAFALATFPRLARVSLAELGIRRPTARELATGVAGTVAMYLFVAVASAIVVAITKRHDTENAIAFLKEMKTPSEQIEFFVLACVLAPIVEELIFRVFLFNALTKYASFGTAVVASGAVFGIVHAFGAPVAQLVTVAIPLAVGGMVLATVYARTRNYWANVTTHGLFNAISVIAIFVFHAKS